MITKKGGIAERNNITYSPNVELLSIPEDLSVDWEYLTRNEFPTNEENEND